jgi:hypothetical protein
MKGLRLRLSRSAKGEGPRKVGVRFHTDADAGVETGDHLPAVIDRRYRTNKKAATCVAALKV